MLIATQRYREAIAELQPAVAVDHPDRARFLFGLSTAHVLAGDIAEGRRYGSAGTGPGEEPRSGRIWRLRFNATWRSCRSDQAAHDDVAAVRR
jgi:hypothetical protein